MYQTVPFQFPKKKPQSPNTPAQLHSVADTHEFRDKQSNKTTTTKSHQVIVIKMFKGAEHNICILSIQEFTNII